MGMYGCFAPLPAATLTEWLNDPSLLESRLFNEDDSFDPPGAIDIDKAWHGLHYLLTGTAYEGDPPLSLAIFGGREFEFDGRDDLDAPPRYLTPEQVAQVSQALSALTDAQLRARYQPGDMEAREIYPDVIWVREGEEALDYLMDNFAVLVEFYRDAAARGDAVLQWIS